MFKDFELSRFGGRPVRLFQFTLQGLVWRFCNAPQDLTIGGFTYLAAQIDRSEIRQTVERAKDKLKITMAYLRDPNAPTFPATQSLGDNWHPYVPSDTMRVICMSTHIGDTDPPQVEWMGIVAQPEFTDVQLTLTCEPGTAIAQALQQGPKWQRGCWKTVYSTGPRGCGLVADGGLSVTTPVIYVEGDVVAVQAYGNAIVSDVVSWVAGGETLTANIVSRNGLALTLDATPTGLAAGDTLTLYTIGIKVATVLTAVAGLQVTSAAFVDAPLTLAGGWIEWTRTDGFVERRTINAHSGAVLTLLYGAADLAAGLEVVAVPSCEQTWDACSKRFPDPQNHYGGAIFKPVKNPGDQSMSWG